MLDVKQDCKAVQARLCQPFARKAARKASQKAYDAKPERKAARRAYAATPEGKASRRAFDAKPERKSARQAYAATPEGKAAQQAYNAKPERKATARKRAASDGALQAKLVQARKKRRQAQTAKMVPAQSARAQRPEVFGRDGAWKRAAEQVARLCQQPSMDYCPPVYAALSLPACLSMTAQMYECLQQAEWRTCVVCWRAWYDPPQNYDFEQLVLGRKAVPVPWFNLAESSVLGARKRHAVNQWCLRGAASAQDALTFLAANYPEDECRRITEHLVCPARQRSVTICSACVQHVREDSTLAAPEGGMRVCDYVVDPMFTCPSTQGPQAAHERFQGASWPSSASHADASPVLGLSVHVFATAVAMLSDHEEMVLALVHPLVQVYTIPRTGQLAYVGHICNFRQKVSKFLSSLPTMPDEMPFVQVRPRKYKNHVPPKALFKVDVQKLRLAFAWLKTHNPYYHDVEWSERAATAWEDPEVVIGVVREASDDDGQPVPVSSQCFQRWMQHAQNEAMAGDLGYPIGRRLFELLTSDLEEDTSADLWNVMRQVVAEVFEKGVFRMATSLPQDILSVALCARGVLDLGLPLTLEAQDTLHALRSLAELDSPIDLQSLRGEIDAIMLELTDEEPKVVSTGSIAETATGDDVGLRSDVVDSLASIAEEVIGESGRAPGSASDLPQGDEPHPEKVGEQQRKLKYPRVDPPEIEDQPGQAIREDTPGYIPKAFPKLFPYGTGDYHADHGGLARTLRFEEWGRYVMLWFDGRFMRHTRFRYWLLDTMLRVMVPGVQRTFFRTREACQDYTLQSLVDPQLRRELVQQMSSATDAIPGSIGERRKMRQELEAMVHQVEAETADLGMNGGAGRIPSGFCTLTCAVYKWAQLHETVLKSYPSGPSDNPAYREYYTKWQDEAPGAAREAAMKKCYYELAVQNPGAVAWYCALKLEMAVALTKALLTEQLRSAEVPGLEEAKAKLEEELRSRLGVDFVVEDIPDLAKFGHVDDEYVSFEWSSGGMFHAHMAFWVIGAPRIDKIEVPQEREDEGEEEEGEEGSWVEIDVQPDGVTVTPQSEAADRLAAFWDRGFTEFNVAKAMAGKEADSTKSSAASAWTDLSALASAVGVRQGLTHAEDKRVRQPESISYEAHAHCLLRGLQMSGEDEDRCWNELQEILQGCGRATEERLQEVLGEPSSASSEARRARARIHFVAALAEWVNMHDLHKPYALGPPGKDQSCAHVEHEHSTKETVHCNKLYPRKLIAAGMEEVAEDPRRRDLYRLWMARNCHFLNNFVPLVMLALLANMDFQATLSKDAVIEYMTKYMTKSGQGALIKVMEHSFALCIEKARENKQGTGSAMLRWFNLQSITEVKSQLECMHLIFAVPRFLCSREFRHLFLKSEIRQAKTKEKLRHEGDATTSIVEKSQAEHYVTRHTWEVPSDRALLQHHPLTDEPLWKFILRRVGVAAPSDTATFSDIVPWVHRHWRDFLELLSWWELKRYFNRYGNTVVLKPKADVVVVHPVGRFPQARTDAQWKDACFWTLLAHCNHGELCATTFRDAAHLGTFDDAAVADLTRRFVRASPEERAEMRMAPCPPHVAKAWHLGMARREAAEERRHSTNRVTQSLTSVKYVFTEMSDPWQQMLWETMSSEDQAAASQAWQKAEYPPGSASAEDKDEAQLLAEEEDAAIDKAMVAFMRNDLKWTHRELHDALLTAGVSVPLVPSMRNYIAALHAQYGNADTGFLPQSFHSHTKTKIQNILRILGRTGAKLGGTLADSKGVLAQRLAHWLNCVLEAGRAKPGAASDEEKLDDESCRDCSRQRKQLLVEHTPHPGEVPPGAIVTAEQAESALGRTMASELDADMAEAGDGDTKEEEEALAGRQVNPNGVDYSCISWQPDAPGAASAQTMGWESDRPARSLSRPDFACAASEITGKLQKGLSDITVGFLAEFQRAASAEGYLARVQGLDPTQKLIVDVIVEWAESRKTWATTYGAPGAARRSPPLPPKLQLLLLGTAGTGKTHTAKVGITEVRIALGSYDSVLTMAFSGVASANLGTGSRTIDSIFHTNRADAGEDLTGPDLDTLVDELEYVQLMVIDEISTCGAASLEVVSRRMQQVARVLWRRNFRCAPPANLGSFGGVGVVLMGDFAQIPPVLSTSLMPGMPLVESSGDSGRCLALAGRQTFNEFEDVIRLRRIHRQKGVCPFKESTMRLRDAALTLEDYSLWKTHELEDVDPTTTCPWPGSGRLLEEALFLVPENMPAGRVNGQRLAARSPLHSEPGAASSTGVVVRCEARHNKPGGDHRRAEDFKHVRQALHLCVGARVMLTQNRLWNVPTVPFGLMNGARGVVVAILYAAPGSARADGNELAGTGFPTTTPGSFPRGPEQCPLPDMIVVHFPAYTGPPCFANLPRTWVAVPCVEVRHQRAKTLARVGIPLRLSWALTFHKSQGITAEEGCVISFDGARGAHTVSKLGLAFVAWTRATRWEKMAFHKLPPLEEFIAARLTREFAARSNFESKADYMFAAFLQKCGMSMESLVQAHENHFKATVAKEEGREASHAELVDLHAMMTATGVAPVSDSIVSYSQQRVGQKTAGLWSFVASFRADKRKTKTPGPASAASRAQQTEPSSCTEVEAPTPAEDAAVAVASAAAEDAARQTMVNMGFDVVHITAALEQTGFAFGPALVLLLNGLDQQRTRTDGQQRERFRRHGLQTVATRQVKDLTGNSVFSQYTQRVADSFGLTVAVWDLGQYAGATAAACFWLSLAAGLSQCNGDVLGQALPAEHQARALLAQLRSQSLAHWVAGVQRSALGLLAQSLRQHFCAGPSSVLLRADIKDIIYPAFASLTVRAARRTQQHYERWVSKLATKEYADELVVVAVAMELSIRIVVVPYTPVSAVAPWAIPTYGPAGAAQDASRTMYLGNNDVHYVYLKPEE